MSLESLTKNSKYAQAIKDVSPKAMEIGRQKPYYMNFKEKKEMGKEVKRIINAQITVISKGSDKQVDYALLNKQDEYTKSILKNVFSADDVLVEIHDFVREV